MIVQLFNQMPLGRAMTKKGYIIGLMRGVVPFGYTPGRRGQVMRTSGVLPCRRLFLQTHPPRIRRGVFRSIVDLQAAINRYLTQPNNDAKPFVWTKPADAILADCPYLPFESVH